MTLAVADSGAGPAVLLLHAFPCDASMWLGQVPALVAAGFRVLVPDLPGFGGSALPSSPPDLDAVVDDLVTELRARQLESCAVVGLSLGGYLAMALLRRSPETVSALALVDTKGTQDPEAALANRLAVADRALAENSTEFLVDATLPGLLGATSRAERPEVVARVSGWIRGSAPATIAWYQRAMAARPESLATLAAFRRPALVAVGAEDDVLSPMAEQELMLSALPEARLAIVPAAGHLSAVENPGALADLLVGFLTETLVQE